MTVTCSQISFVSEGQVCRGSWYEPAQASGACVVMAHGLGGLRTAGLAPYAQRFAEAGLAVLLFDYRHFGSSDGLPRQRVSVHRQLADWSAAVACARAQPGVAEDRVVLWGTSFSGGHVIVTAARDGRVAAVSAQCPMVDGLAASWNIVRYAGARQLLRLAGRGLRDLGRAARGAPRLGVPLVGAPGTLALMTTPDAEPGYRAIVGPDWVNSVCASFALGLAFYRPVSLAQRLRCPALMIVADDSVAPASAAVRAAQRIGSRCELHQWPQGHFDLYVGAAFERGVALQLDFFSRVLALAPAARPGPAGDRAVKTSVAAAPAEVAQVAQA